MTGSSRSGRRKGYDAIYVDTPLSHVAIGSVVAIDGVDEPWWASSSCYDLERGYRLCGKLAGGWFVQVIDLATGINYEHRILEPNVQIIGVVEHHRAPGQETASEEVVDPLTANAA